MIYKLTFIFAAIAALVSLHFANEFRQAAQQATLALEASRQELTAAQNDEGMSQGALERAVDLHGDITEEEYAGLEKQSRELTEKAMALSTELENLRSSNRRLERELHARISTLRYSANALSKEVAELEKAVNEKSISDAAALKGPMSPENITRIIRARMNLYRRENANLAYFEALYSVEEIALRPPKVLCIYPEDRLEKVKEYIECYSPRAEKLIEVGVNKEEQSIQMIIARVFKLVKRSDSCDSDVNCYAIITYHIDDDGKVDSEDFYDTPSAKSRPKLGKGYAPFRYDGETAVVSK